MGKKQQRTGQVDWYIFLLVFIGTALVVLAEMRWTRQTWQSAEQWPYLIILGCLCVLGAVVWAGINYISNVRSDSELRVKLQRLKGQQELVEQLAAQSHEFQNQITVVYTMLQMGKLEQALGYIESISGRNRVTVGPGGSAFFSLLSAKMTRAHYQGVQFAVQLGVNPVALNHRDDDLVCILGNLCDNAIEAAAQEEDGQGLVKLSLVPAPQEGNILVEVWNNGAYIDSTSLKDIFLPGFTNKGSAGHGYGLWLVQSRVKALGGTVSVESSKETGTLFRLTLPASGDLA